jgi:hypothetical protein
MNNFEQQREQKIKDYDYDKIKSLWTRYPQLPASKREGRKGIEYLGNFESDFRIPRLSERKWNITLAHQSLKPTILIRVVETRNAELAQAEIAWSEYSAHLSHMFNVARTAHILVHALYNRSLIHPLIHRIDAFDYPVEQVVRVLRSVSRSAVKSKPRHPWEMEKSQVEVVKNYSAKIVDEGKADYLIEFYDYDGSIVEANLPKERFKDFPHPVRPGTHFWIIVYRIKSQQETRVSAWPVAKFWHRSWQDPQYA